jgi:hypothetical protein
MFFDAYVPRVDRQEHHALERFATGRKIMINTWKRVLIGAVALAATLSPAFAQSYSFPTYAYLHPENAQRHDNGRVVHSNAVYNYAPATDEGYGPSAAARGSSH